MKKRTVPFISVIMPARNEGRYIASCLQSLLRCSYPPHRWEIIIADGMSEDNTRDEIARIARTARVPITVVDNPRRVTPLALNLALARARGDIIIRVDAHAEFGDDYITRCVAVSQESQAENVGGPVKTLPGANTRVARAIAVMMAHPFGVGNSAFRTSTETREVDTVPFGCFRARVFHTLGLFDERLVRHQDYNMNMRIKRAGGRIVMDGRLASTYFSRSTLHGMVRKAWMTGFWAAMGHGLHPYTFCPRHALPGVFTLGTLIALGLVTHQTWHPTPLWLGWLSTASCVPVALYLLLDLAVATRLALKHDVRAWPAFLFGFPAFHYAYGAGYLWGWLRYALRLYPWQPADGVPSWEERHVDEPEEERLAA